MCEEMKKPIEQVCVCVCARRWTREDEYKRTKGWWMRERERDFY